MASNTKPRIAVGQQLGPYRVERFIGKGGMGEVYLAKDVSLERHVAVKILNEEMAKDEEISNRFNQEGKALARLNHPGLVTIFGVGEVDGISYLAMEYVEGLSLASYLEHGTFGVKEAIHLVIQILDGISAAHKNGVVHRDMKPGNIIIDEEHKSKIIDFGIARVLDADKSLKTVVGSVMGTLNYLSPEVARGLAPTTQTDIYAIGVIFFEMLTGQRPFSGTTTLETLEKIKVEPLQFPASAETLIPESVQAIILKMTAKNLEQRSQSAVEVIKELRALQLGDWPSDLQDVWPRCDIANESEIHEHLKGQGFDKNEFGLIIHLAWQLQKRDEYMPDATVKLVKPPSRLHMDALAEGIDQYRKAKEQARKSQQLSRNKLRLRAIRRGGGWAAFAGGVLAMIAAVVISFKNPASTVTTASMKTSTTISASPATSNVRDPAATSSATAGTTSANSSIVADAKKYFAKVYVGEEGEKVSIIYIDPPSVEDRRVLIRYEGTGSEYDGRLVAHRLHAYDQKEDYRMDAERYVSVTLRHGRYEVYPKGIQRSPVVKYSKDETARLNSDEVVKEFQSSGGKWIGDD